jgi:hypothetical protein
MYGGRDYLVGNTVCMADVFLAPILAYAAATQRDRRCFTPPPTCSGHRLSCKRAKAVSRRSQSGREGEKSRICWSAANGTREVRARHLSGRQTQTSGSEGDSPRTLPYNPTTMQCAGVGNRW